MRSIAATSFVLETEFRHKSSRTSFQLRADVSTGYFSQHVPGVTNMFYIILDIFLPRSGSL